MPESPERIERQRLLDIERAKGLAIVLVVLGHIVHETPAGNDWYQVLRNGIYQFHMPFVMYLSGIVMFHTGAAWTDRSAYMPLLGRRAARLLVPFVLFGVLAVFVKAAAGSYIAVHHKVTATTQGILHALGALFWDTHTSPASSVWYLFVLFECYVIVPPMLWAVRTRVWPLVAFGIVWYFTPMPEYLYLDRLGHEFAFFMLGGLASQFLVPYQHRLDRWSAYFIALFVLLVLGWPPPTDVSANPFAPTVQTAIIAATSLPALHALVRRPVLGNSLLLLDLGSYSLVIYLFNTLFIGIATVALHAITSWDGTRFLIVAPLLLLAGTLGPISLKAVVLRRFKTLDKLTN